MLTLPSVTLENFRLAEKKETSAVVMSRSMVSEKELASMGRRAASMGTLNTSRPATSGSVTGEAEGEAERITFDGTREELAERVTRAVPVPVSDLVAVPEAESVASADRVAVAVPEAESVASAVREAAGEAVPAAEAELKREGVHEHMQEQKAV